MASRLHRRPAGTPILSKTLNRSRTVLTTCRHFTGLSTGRGDRVVTGSALNPVDVSPWWPQKVHSTHFRPNITPSLRGYATVLDQQPPPPGRIEYPFPPHANPTPHEIFHLPRAATQPQIKARYYQLVRYHHPDSHHCRCLPGDQAHARFQKIVAAYDYLRGATSSPHPGAKRYGFDAGSSHFDPYLHELSRRRRAQQAANAHRHWSEGFGAPKAERADEFDQNGSKERMMLGFGVLALALGLYPSFVLFPFHLEKTHKAAVLNLAQARNDAKEMGEQRRTEIRKRVEGMQRDAPEVGGRTNSSSSVDNS